MNHNKQSNLDAFVADVKSVFEKHNIILDKYVTDEETMYVFKTFPDDATIELEQVISPVYHGPPSTNPNIRKK